LARAANSLKETPVASSTRPRLSVDGQRGLPFAAILLDGLKVVASRPDRRAKPEALVPAREAKASIAVQN
jgi:hypothetical protein